MLFPIAIRQKNNQYFGILPDLPELSIVAPNIAEVISQGRFVIIKHLLSLCDQGKPLPKGSDISDHLGTDDAKTPNKFAGFTWAIISIDAARVAGTNVKLSVELPESLLTRARDHLTAQGLAANTSQKLKEENSQTQTAADVNDLIIKALVSYLATS